MDLQVDIPGVMTFIHKIIHFENRSPPVQSILWGGAAGKNDSHRIGGSGSYLFNFSIGAHPEMWVLYCFSDPILMSLKEGYKKESKVVFKPPIKEKKSVVVNGIDLLENVPPRTENEVRNSSWVLSNLEKEIITNFSIP